LAITDYAWRGWAAETGGVSVRNLAAYVAAVEVRSVQGSSFSVPDCVARVWGAYVAMFGRVGNRPIEEGQLLAPDPGGFEDAVGARFVRLGEVKAVVSVLEERPDRMAVFVVRPPNRPAHVFAAVSVREGRHGAAGVRWVDTQVPGVFAKRARPVGDDADERGKWLSLPDTRVLLIDEHGRPLRVSGGSGRCSILRCRLGRAPWVSKRRFGSSPRTRR
jgi:hypothetical protein